MFNDNDRGQVGIGTLIVFIAMVLVAAIAAGVLINTAGLLQSQAEATGEETSEQISDRILVQTVTGTANDSESNAAIERVNLTVARSPGAGDIDLSNAIIEVFANGESATLTNGSLDDAGEFEIKNITTTGDGEVLADSGDRSELVFKLADGGVDEDNARLLPGNTVSIQVTTAAGGTTFVEKRAPSSIDKEETVRL